MSLPPSSSHPDAFEVQTEHEKTMEAARQHMVMQSKGENGKKRKNTVEKYLYQFMKGHGQTSTKAFKDGWDRIFGQGPARDGDGARDAKPGCVVGGSQEESNPPPATRAECTEPDCVKRYGRYHHGTTPAGAPAIYALAVLDKEAIEASRFREGDESMTQRKRHPCRTHEEFNCKECDWVDGRPAEALRSRKR